MAAGLALLFSGPLVAADADEAFTTDRKQFKKQVKTIALTPVDADGYFQMPDRVAVMIEQEITARLEKRVSRSFHLPSWPGSRRPWKSRWAA